MSLLFLFLVSGKFFFKTSLIKKEKNPLLKNGLEKPVLPLTYFYFEILRSNNTFITYKRGQEKTSTKTF